MNGLNSTSRRESSAQPDNSSDRLIPRDPQGFGAPPTERAPGEMSAFEFLQEHQSASTTGAPAHTTVLPPPDSQPLSFATDYPARTSSLPAGATALNPKPSDGRVDISMAEALMKGPDIGVRDLQEKGSRKSLRESVSRIFRLGKKEDKTGKP
jgi:hypothetical protein